MSLNNCTVLASALSFNPYLGSVPVYLTKISQIRRLYDFEWGTLRHCLIGAWQKAAVAHFKVKGKAAPLQAWRGPEGSRKLRFPDFMTTAQGGGKVVSLTYRPHLPPGNSPGTHFC